ncbi:MAG: CAP domain-containing protein [Gammaproteobacteria bacterium]
MVRIFYLVLCLTGFVFFQACTSSSNSKEIDIKNKLSTELEFKFRFLNAINNARAQARNCGKNYFPAASALRLDNRLNKAAYEHSQDMFKYQFLEHVSSNGDTLVERMRDANYSWRAIAENIAHNQKNIDQVIKDWLSSPGHCSNMMSALYTHTGVAQVNRYWTQVYATPK